MELIIITGLSGAGKSQAIKAFEDRGYYCVDNLPPILIDQVLSLCEENVEDIRKVALVTDIRGGGFFAGLMQEIEQLKNRDINYKILFIDASDEVLIRRFKASRRSHPMTRGGSIQTAINKERLLLEPIKQIADHIIDTSNYTQGQFKNYITTIFGSYDDKQTFSISVMSFGYKKGIPKDADFVFDVRFLPNPYYIDQLRHHTGNDKDVQDYVMSFKESITIYESICNLLDKVLPLCEQEARSELVIAIGCTGGRHRSVTLANRISEYISGQAYVVHLLHRDVGECKI